MDHPGSNGEDPITAAGFVLHWQRVDDLRSALNAVLHDPQLGPHLDSKRVGVAGFSLGGFAALTAAGARGDLNRLLDFCRANPGDGLCLPQQEFPVALPDAVRSVQVSDFSSELPRAADDHSIPGLRAAFAMAPAPVPEFQPDSLREISTPVMIVVGDADTVARPSSNGLAAAQLIPQAETARLSGVGHYDFLSICTPAAQASLQYCRAMVPQEETHRTVVQAALAFFERTLGPP